MEWDYSDGVVFFEIKNLFSQILFVREWFIVSSATVLDWPIKSTDLNIV